MKILSTFGLLSILSGCHLGQPQLFEPGPIRYQQSRAILHDPYPDVDAGPDVVGARPRDFQQPQPPAVRNQWLYRNF